LKELEQTLRCCWVSDGYRRWIWMEIEELQSNLLFRRSKLYWKR
jgi:hypothetical protein